MLPDISITSLSAAARLARLQGFGASPKYSRRQEVFFLQATVGQVDFAHFWTHRVEALLAR